MYIDIMKRSTPPPYVAKGVEQWIAACTEQAKHGLGGIQGTVKYTPFHEGMLQASTRWAIDSRGIVDSHHQLKALRRNIGAMDERLGLDRLNLNGSFDCADDECIVVPEFRTLLRGCTTPYDIERAGASFVMGSVIDKIVKETARIELIDGDVMLPFRAADVAIHDRQYTEKEQEYMYAALAARRDAFQFYREHGYELRHGEKAKENSPATKQLREQYDELTSKKKALTDAWWQQVKQYVAKE